MITKQIGEHESKFVFPNARAKVICSWLKLKCQQDPLYAKGIVSSIYFDTRDWTLLGEKLNSTYLKTKVRLRYHSDAKSGEAISAAYLEVKNKIGSARKKMRIKTDLDVSALSSLSLHDPALLGLPHILYEHGFVLPQQLIPAFQINYLRHRFIEPLTDARLSVDSDINVSKVNRLMVQKKSDMRLKSGVFEFKHNQPALPQWLHQISAFGGRREAFSKYSTCFCAISGTVL